METLRSNGENIQGRGEGLCVVGTKILACLEIRSKLPGVQHKIKMGQLCE